MEKRCRKVRRVGGIFLFSTLFAAFHKKILHFAFTGANSCHFLIKNRRA